MSGRLFRALPVPARRITQIALPAIAESYLLNLLGVVDTLFIARLGLVQLDAVGVTNIFSMTYIGVFTAVSAALSVFLARSVGAGRLHRGRSVVWHGLVAAFAVGLLAAALSVGFAPLLLHLVGARGALQLAAMPYFTWVLAMSPLIALFTAQSAAFRAIGDTRTPLRIGLEMNAIHVILDYFLIFGIGALHGLGLTGAGLAMVFARLYAFARLWYRSRRVPAIRITVSAVKMDFSLLISMMRFAVPVALERLAKRLGQVVYFGLIVRTLAIDTLSQPFLAAVLIDSAAIQAGGNSTYPMVVTTVGIWAIRTLGVYLFAWRLGFGLPAVWASIAVDNAVRAALFAWYRKKHGFILKLSR